MKKMQDSKKRIAFPIQLKFDESDNRAKVPSELHVVPTGKWDHPAYGEMEITTADIAEFIKNFKAKVRRDIPITAGHDNGMSGGELPAIGWFTDLYERGIKGLYAVVEWTDEGKRLLQEGAFKYFSPEFYTEYEDPETRERFSNVLVGGALTNKPYFKELDAVVLSFSEPAIINQFNEDIRMNIEDILKKDAKDVTAEERAFLKSKESELSDEQKESAKDLLADEGGDNDGDGSDDGDGSGEGAGDEGGEGAGGEGEEGADGKKTASEKKKVKGQVMVSAAELNLLRQNADKGQKAFAELETMKIETRFSTLVFSESNKSGRFLPKQQKAVVGFMKSLSESQRDQFVNIIKEMAEPKLDFSEKGDGGTSASNVEGQIKAKVQEKIKASEGKLQYSAALKQVFAENPELEAEYNKQFAD